MDLVLSGEGRRVHGVFSQSEENVATATSYAHAMIGSDSLSLHAGRGRIAASPIRGATGRFRACSVATCGERRLFPGRPRSTR